MIPDLPSTIQATHSPFLFKNIFIPPINTQRLLSLNDRLIILGPPEMSVELLSRKTRLMSEDTGVSDVINMFDTGIIVTTDSSDNSTNVENDLTLNLNGGQQREKRELNVPNLGNIKEEAEASVLESSVAQVSGNAPRVNRLFVVEDDQSKLSVLEEMEVIERLDTIAEVVGVELDTNNNADKEQEVKKENKVSTTSLVAQRKRANSRVSQLGSIDSTSASLPSDKSQPQTATPSTDIMSQILGAAADSSGADKARCNSVLGLNQRPSILGMNSSGVGARSGQSYQPGGSRANVALSKSAFASKTQSQASIAAIMEHRVRMKDRPKSREGRLATDKSKSAKGHSMAILTNTMDERSEHSTNSSSEKSVIARKNEKGISGQRGIEGKVPKEDTTTARNSGSYSEGSDSNREGSTNNTSRNDSEDSDELRNFQDTLKKKDILVLGQAIIDREKNMMHSIQEYRRRSMLDDISLRHDRVSSAGLESIESNVPTDASVKVKKPLTSDQKSQESREGRTHSLGPLKGNAVHRHSTYSHETLSSMGPAGTQKMFAHKPGSQVSVTDMAGWSAKRRVTTGGAEFGSSQKKSVMNIDARSREIKDGRFAVADRLARESHHQGRVAPSSQGNEHINMLLSAADGASGPFKPKASYFDSINNKDSVNKSARMSVVDERLLHHLDVPVLSTAQRSTPSNDAMVVNRLSLSNIVKAVPTERDSATSNYKYTTRSSIDNSFEPINSFRDSSAEHGILSNPENEARNSSSVADQWEKGRCKYGLQSPRVTEAPLEEISPMIFSTSCTVLENERSDFSFGPFVDFEPKPSDVPSDPSRAGDGANKYRKKTIEVHMVNAQTGQYEQFDWRWMTVKLCKNAPITHCFGMNPSMLYYVPLQFVTIAILCSSSHSLTPSQFITNILSIIIILCQQSSSS